MSAPTVRIAIVGCALAGKTATLLSILARGGYPVSDQSFVQKVLVGENEFAFARREGANTLLALSMSSARAVLGQYDPADPACEAKILREIDVIVAADALILVIDSDAERQPANERHFERLRRDLAFRGRDIDEIPLVVQANKRDLSGAMSLALISERFRTRRSAVVEAVATRSQGTLEAVRSALDLAGR